MRAFGTLFLVVLIIFATWSRAAEEGYTKNTGYVEEHKTRKLLSKHSNKTFFRIYSALHDPEESKLRVFAEAFPPDRCQQITSCEFPDEEIGPEGIIVTPLTPFGGSGGDIVEPVECFITCTIPKEIQDWTFNTVVLRNEDGAEQGYRKIERIIVANPKKSVGMCIGPVFSDVPQWLDFLEWHADLGVEGFHVYVANVDTERTREVYRRGAPLSSRLTLSQHHLVTWHEHFQVDYDMPTRYYRQFLIINECVWRNRQTFDVISVIDRDEFIWVEGFPKKKVDLAGMIKAHLQDSKFKSASMFTAFYNVHCVVEEVATLGTDRSHVSMHLRTKDDSIMVYKGYDMWAGDDRIADFTNCSADISAQLYKPPGRNCHTKTFVLPLFVEAQGPHFINQAIPGYMSIPKPLNPNTIFVKHMRCTHAQRVTPEEGSAQIYEDTMCTRKGPPNYAESADEAGVEVCRDDKSKKGVKGVWDFVVPPDAPLV